MPDCARGIIQEYRVRCQKRNGEAMTSIRKTKKRLKRRLKRANKEFDYYRNQPSKLRDLMLVSAIEHVIWVYNQELH